MLLVLILFWRRSVQGLRGWPNIFPFISLLGRFNSRLGLFKFPFSRATGIGSQGIDLARGFCGRMAVSEGRSTIFPVIFPSNGKFGAAADGAGSCSGCSRLALSRRHRIEGRHEIDVRPRPVKLHRGGVPGCRSLAGGRRYHHRDFDKKGLEGGRSTARRRCRRRPGRPSGEWAVRMGLAALAPGGGYRSSLLVLKRYLILRSARRRVSKDAQRSCSPSLRSFTRLFAGRNGSLAGAAPGSRAESCLRTLAGTDRGAAIRGRPDRRNRRARPACTGT
jgi:hypothetical protein